MTGKKLRHGFTLIELLVVVAIIAILMSLLMPALRNAREAAKTVKCAANMKSISMGLILYCTESNDSGPTCSNIYDADGVYQTGYTLSDSYFGGIGLPKFYTSGLTTIRWSDYIYVGRYTQNMPKVAYSRTGVSGYADYSGRTVWTCPADARDPFSDRNGRYLSYAVYSYAWPRASASYSADQIKTNYTNRLIKYSQVKGPQRTMLALDGYDSYFDQSNPLTSLSGPWSAKRGAMLTNGENGHQWYSNRHNNRTNVVFFDGHVEAIGDMYISYMARNFKVYPRRDQDIDSD